MQKQNQILIIGKVLPEPNSSAAGARMMQLIELFQSQNWKITFTTAAGESKFAENLPKLGIDLSFIKLNDSFFDSFIKELNPDIVLFDRFMTEEQFGWRVAEQCPDALRILDTEDLHCLRAGRHQALKEARAFKEVDLFSDHAKREIASILRSDLSLIISAFEEKLLKKVFKVDKELLHYAPFMLNPIKETQKFDWVPYEDRSHFISIGNFLHGPNWDAVRYLKEIIWPKIRAKIPEAELYVYGAYPSQKVFQLDNPKEGFLVKGRAKSAFEVMQNARVCLAPLRFGAGLKGKLINAMQCGTPSITSSIGAEAMYGELPWSGAIADDSEEFVEAAVNLYSDKERWVKAQNVGAEIINKIYPKKEIGERLLVRIKTLKLELELQRKRNFIGAMLMHHTASSTKFMSKWIEEKNK